VRKKTPDQAQKERILKLVKDFLGKEYVKISFSRLLIEEDLEEQKTIVECVVDFGTGPVTIKCAGRGMVDALFEGMRQRLKGKYLSLSEVSFKDFSFEIDLSSGKRRAKTDVSVEVSLCTLNSNKRPRTFSAESRSFNVAAAKSVISAVEYYLNCEKAVLKLKQTILGARQSGRPELEIKYINLLSEIVQSTSYEKAIKNWKQRS